MKFNLRRCFFHSIVPLCKKDTLFKVEDGQIERLKLMLKSGYIYPGNMLKDVISDEFNSHYDCHSDSVFLAQHTMTELPSYGGSFFDGEFSAYLEHIIGNPSWVFSEDIVKGKKVENRAHMLSEEVCIQEPIDLHEAIAVMLPYDTPATKVAKFLQFKEIQLDEDYYDEEVKQVLRDRNRKLVIVYAKIQRWKKILVDYGYDIPCINQFGMELDLEEEYLYMLENDENVRKLLKK